MSIAFTKMHGLGNDFVVIDAITQQVTLDRETIARLGDRHTGIGFDQLLMVETPDDPDADFRYRIYNTDGTEAEQCGNGARCFARFVRDRQLTVKRRIVLQTGSGRISCEVQDDRVDVDMGEPDFRPEAIPFDPAAASASDNDCSFAVLSRPSGASPAGASPAGGGHPGTEVRTEARTVARTAVEAEPGADTGAATQTAECAAADADTIRFVPVSLGNPHAVIFVDDVASAPVAEVGAMLQRHPCFPASVNVGFCEIVDPGFMRLRVFERGVGETRACGSGACAAVAAAIRTGRIGNRIGNRIKISLPGGKLRIAWQGSGHGIRMAGPAAVVFEGRFEP